MPLRLLYAAVILSFLTVHGIAIQKMSALTADAPTASTGIASGD